MLVSDPWSVKISDFGMARVATAELIARMSMATLIWSAPELQEYWGSTG
jgi:serine/threonine protein kinase